MIVSLVVGCGRDAGAGFGRGVGNGAGNAVGCGEDGLPVSFIVMCSVRRRTFADIGRGVGCVGDCGIGCDVGCAE